MVEIWCTEVLLEHSSDTCGVTGSIGSVTVLQRGQLVSGI